jgi:hypothetical protein
MTGDVTPEYYLLAALCFFVIVVGMVFTRNHPADGTVSGCLFQSIIGDGLLILAGVLFILMLGAAK